MDALEQFERQEDVKKLKITSKSMPSDLADLIAFLYDQVIHIWIFDGMYIFDLQVIVIFIYYNTL